MLQCFLERIELAAQQQAGRGHRCKARDALGRCLGPVRRAKGVHDEHVAEGCVPFGQALVILFFARVEANVFTENDLAGLDLDTVQPVFLQPNRLTQEFSHALGHGLHGKLRIGLALDRSPQVGQQHHRRALFQRQPDGGQ